MLERFEKGRRTEEDGTYREVFLDREMTLFVWYRHRDSPRKVVGFQVVWPADRMIAWNENGQVRYCRLSRDDDSGLSGGRSPIATRDLGSIPAEDVREFERRAARMDRETAQSVLRRISSR